MHEPFELGEIIRPDDDGYASALRYLPAVVDLQWRRLAVWAFELDADETAVDACQDVRYTGSRIAVSEKLDVPYILRIEPPFQTVFEVLLACQLITSHLEQLLCVVASHRQRIVDLLFDGTFRYQLVIRTRLVLADAMDTLLRLLEER